RPLPSACSSPSRVIYFRDAVKIDVRTPRDALHRTVILLTHRQRWRVNHVLSGRYPAISPNSPSAVTVGWVSLSTPASNSRPARSPRGRPSLRDFSRAQLELRPAAEKSKGGH